MGRIAVRPVGQWLGCLLWALLGLCLAGAAAAKEPTIKDQRLAACYDDMVRLCPGDPDKVKLKTCIRLRRALVSGRCRAWLDKSD